MLSKKIMTENAKDKMTLLVVSIESPLGGGKGFFLKYMRQHKEWIERQGFNGKAQVHVCLQDDSISHVMDMNNDEKRWALFTELDFLYKHVANIKFAHDSLQGTNAVLFLEGSPISDKHCYFDAIESISEAERELYTEWYDILKNHWKMDMSVLMKSSIHSHFDRVMGNSKKEQSFVTLGYLSQKAKRYASLLNSSPKLICENNFEDNEPVLEVMCQVLVDLIYKKHFIR